MMSFVGGGAVFMTRHDKKAGVRGGGDLNLFKTFRGTTEVRTRAPGFKVQCAHHYTMAPVMNSLQHGKNIGPLH